MSPAVARAAARWVASAVALGAVFLLVDLDDLVGRLAGLGPGTVALGVAAGALQVVLSAARWAFTVRRLGAALPLGRAVREVWLATFLNHVLPGGVLGDAGRAVRDGRRVDGPGSVARSVRAVVYERASGQLALALVAIVGVGPMLPLPLQAVAIVVAAALLVLGRLALRRTPPAIRGELRAVFLDGAAPAVQLVLSGALVASYVGVFALAAAATGSALSPGALFAVAPLALLSMTLPVSVAGWGVREAVTAWAFSLLGLTPAAGAAASATYGLLALSGALPGALALPLPPLPGPGAVSPSRANRLRVTPARRGR